MKLVVDASVIVSDCTLITADERYLDSGARMGRVIRLTDWKTELVKHP